MSIADRRHLKASALLAVGFIPRQALSFLLVQFLEEAQWSDSGQLLLYRVDFRRPHLRTTCGRLQLASSQVLGCSSRRRFVVLARLFDEGLLRELEDVLGALGHLVEFDGIVFRLDVFRLDLEVCDESVHLSKHVGTAHRQVINASDEI